MTETSCIASINPFYGERKAGSIGLPIRGQQIEIRSGTGSALPPASTPRSSSRDRT